MEEINEKETSTNQELTCNTCAAILKYKPGTTSLVCEYCGANNEIITESDAPIEEIDFEDFIANKLQDEEKIDIVTVKCTSCGASSTLKPNLTSDQCPFCGVSIVVTNGSTSSILKPKSLLPFKIEQKVAAESFRTWISKLWFAPSNLKKYVTGTDTLVGMYIPYWTYDSNTDSNYTGERGTHYYVTETYEKTENGKTVTETRQVQKTSWASVSGNVDVNFDDVLIIASNSLPVKYTEKLEPWDLENLVPFNDMYLSGFKTESYQVDIKTGFDNAKVKIDSKIKEVVISDIGGDEQRVHSVNTSYNDITFKHILLPLWISAYRYNDKAYRFLVNARTGEVQGERPYSWIKITLFILMIIAIIAGIVYFAKYR
ncbi:MAG: hypothetical protein HXX09_00840 [Bacteroidetes bacterium]|nr:hypothetical protein [Bacteroidota bacterium]